MWIALACFFIAILAGAVAFWVVKKHWKEIRLLDPLSIKEEQDRQNRSKILEQRFERMSADKIQPLRRLGTHVKRVVTRSYEKANTRLQAFEAFYKNLKNPFSTVTPSAREQMNTLIHEGRAFMRDLKWADAERRFIEILSMNPRHAEAYKGLGQIYLKQKLYEQARETFEFLIKLKTADDATHAGLAEIAEAENKLPEAEHHRLKAVELSPRQAFRHAQLAEFYLARKEPSKAWPSAKRASDLEPTSAKYLELSLEIAILLRDQKEAKTRYEKLRLLSDDRTKYQSWREKIEAMEK